MKLLFPFDNQKQCYYNEVKLSINLSHFPQSKKMFSLSNKTPDSQLCFEYILMLKNT